MIRSFDVTARDILTEIILPTYPQAIVASLLLLLVTRAWPPHSLYSVFGFCAFCGALFLALFWSTGMTRDDRTEILSLIFPARYSKRQA